MKCLLEADAATDPRAELAQLLSTISEELSCAGWHMGIEYDAWGWLSALTAHVGVDWCMGEVQPEQIERLRELAAQTGGWVYWHGAEHGVGLLDEGVRFAPLSEWTVMYERHQLRGVSVMACEDARCGTCREPNGPGRAELRPYGVAGAWICFGCSNATPEARATAKQQFLAQCDASGDVAVIGTDSTGPRPATTQERKLVGAPGARKRGH